MSWAAEVPEELKIRPIGLVALAGLDLKYNAVHKIIWDHFCNNRKADRVPLSFVNREPGFEYPKSKPKRTSYEWYIPKGILKRNWMSKQLYEIPSLVITCFDLDWDDPLWQERLMECSTKLQIIRSSLERRSTKIAVVLIQNSPPMPPGEDSVAAERAAAFCTQCELSPKSLFVLPHTDHLFGYIIRLENAFYELAQNYYTTDSRRVKAHRDYLNRSTHQLLFIRHQFKIGFLNEMKQDSHMALKHYKQAYGHCLETKMHDTNILEIKIMSGYINYKICALSFQHNAPLDAIGQFRKHIDFFKPKLGPTDLSFEHSAWFSMQFHLFGDLFDDAIQLGLNALQTQHPGFYYQQAANHAITRKQLCIGLCHNHNVIGNMQEQLDSLEFYGQRPWRAGQQALEIPDVNKEVEGFHSLQNLELRFNHSQHVIGLLNKAVSQFHTHRCVRMQWHLLVLIGEEHYHSKDYAKALQLLTRVAQEFRKENWWHLLTAVLTTALKSAYLLGHFKDYVKFSTEMLAPGILTSTETKTRVQVDLLQVLSGQVPDAEPGCDVVASQEAQSLWQQRCNQGSESDIVVSMNEILPFVQCKAVFKSERYTVDEPIIVDVHVRCAAQFSLRFSKLELVTNIEVFNGKHVIIDEGDLMGVIEDEKVDPNDLLFTSDGMKTFTFTLNASTEDMGKTLEITQILLRLDAKFKVVLECPVNQTHQNDTKWPTAQYKDWSKITSRPSTELACRSTQFLISRSSEEAYLLDEIYCTKWTFQNNEASSISNVRFAYLVEHEESSECHFSMETSNIKASGNAFSHQLETMSQGQYVKQNTVMLTSDTGILTFSVKVLYDMKVEGSHETEQYMQQESFKVEAVAPFMIQTRYMSMKFQDCESVNAGEPFLSEFSLTNGSTCTLMIEKIELQLSEHFPSDDNSVVAQIKEVTLSKDETASECQCLRTPQAVGKAIVPGNYHIFWRRLGDNKGTLVETVASLPSVTVEQLPLYVECELPAYGTVRSPLPLLYQIHNRTGYVQEFELSIDNSDSFVFTGHKQLHFRTLPYASMNVPCTLYPLSPGNLTLPQFTLHMVKHPSVTEQVKRMLPSQVYVMPKESMPIQ